MKRFCSTSKSRSTVRTSQTTAGRSRCTPKQEVDVTGFQSSAREILKGLKDADIEFEVFLDWTAGSTNSIFWPLSQTKTPFLVKVRPKSTPKAADNPIPVSGAVFRVRPDPRQRRRGGRDDHPAPQRDAGGPHRGHDPVGVAGAPIGLHVSGLRETQRAFRKLQLKVGLGCAPPCASSPTPSPRPRATCSARTPARARRRSARKPRWPART